MRPTTAWGNKLLAASWWDEGMRGHFTRLSNATGPEDMEYAITAIEVEAATAERARIAAKVRGLPVFAGTEHVDRAAVIAIVEGEA